MHCTCPLLTQSGHWEGLNSLLPQRAISSCQTRDDSFTQASIVSIGGYGEILPTKSHARNACGDLRGRVFSTSCRRTIAVADRCATDSRGCLRLRLFIDYHRSDTRAGKQRLQNRRHARTDKPVRKRPALPARELPSGFRSTSPNRRCSATRIWATGSTCSRSLIFG